ncbi:MAG: hypothetical protein AB7N91_13850 [Candidatus Tectimicrobiota bacterium]
MQEVYVIQVIAYHGGGIKGWRTVRKPGGAAYDFDTFEAARTALQLHFSNLQEGVNVRVTRMDAATARHIPSVAPTDPADGRK